jgi:hypothetical protein
MRSITTALILATMVAVPVALRVGAVPGVFPRARCRHREPAACGTTTAPPEGNPPP